MKVEVDRDRCIASGQCVMLAPSIFDQDDDGIVELLDGDPTADVVGAVEESIRVCPSLAIRKVDE